MSWAIYVTHEHHGWNLKSPHHNSSPLRHVRVSIGLIMYRLGVGATSSFLPGNSLQKSDLWPFEWTLVPNTNSPRFQSNRIPVRGNSCDSVHKVSWRMCHSCDRFTGWLSCGSQGGWAEECVILVIGSRGELKNMPSAIICHRYAKGNVKNVPSAMICHR